MRFREPAFKLQYDPADIAKLAAEYMATSAEDDVKMEAAGKRIAGGDFSRANLEVICAWKSERRLGLLGRNTDAEIAEALRQAVSASNIKDAVYSLTPLAGVGVKMASAVLTAIDAKCYTVLDYRALEALGTKNSDNVDLYVSYVKACRSMAAEYGVSLRSFDRANWQWSKQRANRGRDAICPLKSKAHA